MASHPDPRHGTLDDDRKSFRSYGSGRRSAGCYSSGSCSRHTSAHHTRSRSARERLSRSAPGGGALPFLDALEQEELTLRQEAAIRSAPEVPVVEEFSDSDFSEDLDDDSECFKKL